jgi:hypothetical protein
MTPASCIELSPEDSAATLARPFTGAALQVSGTAGCKLNVFVTQLAIRPGMLAHALPYADSDPRSSEMRPVFGNLALSTASTVRVVSRHFFVAAGFASRFSPLSASYRALRPGVDSVLIGSPYDEVSKALAALGRGQIRFRCVYGGGTQFTTTVYVVDNSLFCRTLDGILGNDFLDKLERFRLKYRADAPDEVYPQQWIQQLVRAPKSAMMDLDMYFEGGGNPPIPVVLEKEK